MSGPIAYVSQFYPHLTETFVMAQIPEFSSRLDRLQVGPAAYAAVTE